MAGSRNKQQGEGGRIGGARNKQQGEGGRIGGARNKQQGEGGRIGGALTQGREVNCINCTQSVDLVPLDEFPKPPPLIHSLPDPLKA